MATAQIHLPGVEPPRTINDLARAREREEHSDRAPYAAHFAAMLDTDIGAESELQADPETQQTVREMTAIMAALRYKSPLVRMILVLFGLLPKGETSATISHVELGYRCRGDIDEADDKVDQQWVKRRCEQHRLAVERTGERWRLMRVTPGRIERTPNGRDVYVDSVFDLAPLLKIQRRVRELAVEDPAWETDRVAATDAAVHALIRDVCPDRPVERTPAHPDRLLKIMGGYIRSIVAGCKGMSLDPWQYRAEADALWAGALAELPDLDPESKLQFEARIEPDPESKDDSDTECSEETEDQYANASWIPPAELPDDRRTQVVAGDADLVELPDLSIPERPEEASRGGDVLASADQPLAPDAPISTPGSGSNPTGLAQHGAKVSTVTLEAFARYTMLPETFLISVGIGMWTDHKGREYLGIPHSGPDGVLLGMKQRVHLLAPDDPTQRRFSWVEGAAGLYGAECIQEARQRPALIVCEGISDQLTFRYHGMAAVGLSSAATFEALRAEHLLGIPNLIICRDADRAGLGMAVNLSKHLINAGYAGGIFAMTFDEANDASDAHKQVEGDRARFKAAFTRGYANALSMREVKY